MKNYVVKISDKGGDRLERVRLVGNSLSIGRAWGSDVVLQDKFVDAKHLKLTLEEGGVMVLADLATTNGSLVAGKQIRGESTAYRLGDPVRLGDTRLTIFDQSVGVEAASIRSSWFLMADKFKSFPALVALTLLALAISIFSEWLLAKQPLDMGMATISMVVVLVILLLCSATLGFISKLIRGESNIRALWVLACIGIVVVELVYLILLVFRFNIQDLQLANTLGALIFSAIACWLLVGIFTYTSHVTTRYKWLSSLLIVMTIYGFYRSDDLMKKDHQKWSASTVTEDTTLPPAFLWRDSVSLPEYQQQTDKLFEFDLADQDAEL